MAMETHVFFRGKVPSKAALARAIRDLGFPFSIPEAKGSLAAQSGFMPMKLRREETGVELDIFEDRAAIAEHARYGIDQSYERVASFRWGGDMEEAAAGLCGAAALARITHGVVLDEAASKLMSADEAVAVARQFLDCLPKPSPQFGTRPTDIKRYLKPLLALRSDLVLRGRFLIIRPVRHILRGAIFDRTSDKYTFNIWRYTAPLYDASWDDVGLGISRIGIGCEVWQPHFLPALFDSLAEDIFGNLTQIVSLADLAREFEGTHRHYDARVTALLLGGQPERAAMLVAQFERDRNSHASDIEELRSLLRRDMASLCAEFHAKEAESAKTMKLGDIWDPAPFPAELPEADSTWSEPPFATRPWIERPPWLVQELPRHTGETRFATMTHHRNGEVLLVAALSPAQAAEKHRNREHYVAATRLAGGQLVLLIHFSSWSPHNPHQPKNPTYVPLRHLYLWIYGSSETTLANFQARAGDPDTLEFWTIDVRDNSRTLWLAYNQLRESNKLIYDRRSDHARPPERRPMTEADIALCRLATPAAGEIDDLLRRVTTYLKNEGFGELPA